MDLEKVIALIGVVATASGYVAMQSGVYTRYRASVLAWEQRIFESALLGGALFTLARSLVVGFRDIIPGGFQLSAVLTFKEMLPFPMAGSLALTALLGLLLGQVTNVLIRPREALIKIIHQRGTALQIELLDSLLNHRALMFDFKSGRVTV